MGGLRGRSLGQITNVRDEVGGRGEGRVLPGQPDLVRAIPCQHVQVVHEIFPHERMQSVQRFLVSGVDKSSACDFKTVDGAFISRDVCEEV